MDKKKNRKKKDEDGKVKVYIPPGAPRLNMKADREEPPSTLYDGIEGEDWLKRIGGKKED